MPWSNVFFYTLKKYKKGFSTVYLIWHDITTPFVFAFRDRCSAIFFASSNSKVK